MKTKLLSAAFCCCGLTAWAQQPSQSEFAEPAFRSPVVAVEFTGQRCRYCPNLSRSLKEAQEKYGKKNYIITALHSLEDYSLDVGNNVALFNAEAKKYAASIKVHDGLPQLAYNTLGSKVPDHVLDDLFKEDDLLECTGSVNINDKNEYVIKVKTRLRSNQIEAVDGKKIDILFWALENDIVAIQDDNGKWTFPAHQHIFRGSINGTWGESYEIGKEYQHTWAIPEGVSVKENTEVVVFFLDHESKTILDAAQFDVNRGDATGIDDVLSESAGKENSAIYDLSGRRVYKTTKGNIYIQNGKKYLAQ